MNWKAVDNARTNTIETIATNMFHLTSSVALTSAPAFSRTSAAAAVTFQCCTVKGSCAILQVRVTTLSVCDWRVDHFRCWIWLLLLLTCLYGIICSAKLQQTKLFKHSWTERLLTMQEQTQSKCLQNQHVPLHLVELPWHQPLPSAGLLLLRRWSPNAASWRGSSAMLQVRVTTFSFCDWRFQHFRCWIWLLLLLTYVSGIICIAKL